MNKIAKIREDNSLSSMEKGRLIYKAMKMSYLKKIKFNKKLDLELLKEFSK